jgi:hypothetical protein
MLSRMQCNDLAVAVVVEDEPAGGALAIKTALSAAGACIVSAQQLGNQGLVFGFESMARDLERLLEELGRCARLLPPSEANVKRLVYELQPDVEVHGTLHVTLVHAASDQRVPRPRVPG